jgi:hypothetical protein
MCSCRVLPLHIWQDVDDRQVHVWTERDLGREECLGGSACEVLGPCIENR